MTNVIKITPPLFRNENDGRVYDKTNRTVFLVNGHQTADALIEQFNDQAAEIATLKARLAEADKLLGDLISSSQYSTIELDFLRGKAAKFLAGGKS